MQLKNVGKSFGNQAILEDIQLNISPSKFTAFIGPNGAGKSTLLSIMSRLLKKDHGFLSIKGKEIEAWNSKELAKELTILKQKINYQSKLTVEELVSFGRFPYSQDRLTKEDFKKVEQALEYLDILDLRNRFIDTLSGGQLQRVFIAMVLTQDTDFILLDEPLNNLDIKQSISMMKILRSLVDDLGKTIIIVIHDINIASQYVDEIVAFKDGKVFYQGTTNQVMRKEILDPLYEMDITLSEINGKKVCIYL
ncbi:ABC transporter ATP-binding protein [Streptococcus anginosus]|uniref:ABC transporter, ATP-binding protein n=1 Tax=Streptococcus anginosus subsp. whileyi CCUG 39159 TaxID=1095729 RepID=I0SEA3_STRAP|nr:ATP-binding cassette domain-containing protein [Streptococcus anginosus]AGU83954.1 iron complex transport system ATP-binding protein [Streptococcus anginosus C238]EID21706.1 ABC transporter, ATP-binding protein [Streptococcus anginosus subsp. whileyi CCUG 39159]MDB8661857.1 ATP-binding cassette domain-containing protein [Streptococcus anginosus]MDP1385130.1 ATP-binding cassette domain-containing protein [Streptococcus anginosus]QQT08253.1 ATP-binding cassette domain-containing protein [Stre